VLDVLGDPARDGGRAGGVRVDGAFGVALQPERFLGADEVAVGGAVAVAAEALGDRRDVHPAVGARLLDQDDVEAVGELFDDLGVGPGDIEVEAAGEDPAAAGGVAVGVVEQPGRVLDQVDRADVEVVQRIRACRLAPGACRVESHT
jgi:hypothetical protein